MENTSHSWENPSHSGWENTQSGWENPSYSKWENTQPSWENPAHSRWENTKPSWENPSHSRWENTQPSWENPYHSRWENTQPSWENPSHSRWENTKSGWENPSHSRWKNTQYSWENPSHPRWEKTQSGWENPSHSRLENTQPSGGTSEGRGISILVTNRNTSGHLKAKKNACLYCGELMTNLLSHYHACHFGEKDVKAVFALREKNKDGQKDILLEEMRAKGNFNHNLKVLKEESGELIMRKTGKQENIDPKSVVFCPNCLIFMMENNFARHSKNCKKLSDGANPPTLQQARGKLVEKTSNVTGRAADILGQMKNDDLGDIVRNDATLTGYLQHLMLNEKDSDTFRQTLRSNLRLGMN